MGLFTFAFSSWVSLRSSRTRLTTSATKLSSDEDGRARPTTKLAASWSLKTRTSTTLRSTDLFGGNIAEYMDALQDEPEKYKRQFGKYQSAGVGSGDLEALYKSVHASIRSSPAAQKKTPSVPEGTKPKSYKKTPLSYAQRKDRVRQKIASAQKAKAQAK